MNRTFASGSQRGSQYEGIIDLHAGGNDFAEFGAAGVVRETLEELAYGE